MSGFSCLKIGIGEKKPEALLSFFFFWRACKYFVLVLWWKCYGVTSLKDDCFSFSMPFWVPDWVFMHRSSLILSFFFLCLTALWWLCHILIFFLYSIESTTNAILQNGVAHYLLYNYCCRSWRCHWQGIVFLSWQRTGFFGGDLWWNKTKKK